MIDLKKLMADFPAEAAASMPRMAFNAKQEDDQLTVYVHGIIGDTWLGEAGVTSAELVPQINDFGGSKILLNVNSVGGFVHEALSIYTALTEHNATVQANITGEAASAATIIVSAADQRRIASSGTFMIHRAMGLAMGNASIMLETAQWLESADQRIAELLAERSGNKVDQVSEWMAGTIDGTEFSGKEAVKNGFADELIPNKSKSKPKNQAPAPLVGISNLERAELARRYAAAKSA